MKKKCKKSVFEPIRSKGGGGYPDFSGSTTKKTLYVCVFPSIEIISFSCNSLFIAFLPFCMKKSREN